MLQNLIDSDEDRAVRQVGIIDSKGNTATWTGDKCINEAGHLAGENYSVTELRRLLTVSRAYQHMNRGDHAIENNLQKN